MKTIKNGLVAVTLASSLGGCATTLQNLMEDKTCSESAEYEVEGLEAETTFRRNSYNINLKGTDTFFTHEEDLDVLLYLFMDRAYFDRDLDGNADGIYIISSREILEINDEQKESYRHDLSFLKKNEVHRVWERCRDQLPE